YFAYFIYSCVHHLHLHSFPTRRSSDLLKTTVQKYTPGSETRRAVTTVGGATKLTVQSQLCRPDGQIILERTVNGNVRFMGSNLRSEEHTSELQSLAYLVCRLLLEKKKK